MGDLNEDLINFYRQVQQYPLLVAEGMADLPSNRDEYYRQRALKTAELTEMEQAVRFFFLNRHCFNGVYRTNKNGDFNVPFGSRLTEIPKRDEIVEFSKKIENIDFLAADFETTLNLLEPDDFVYLDPPYAGTESRDRGEYGLGSFKTDDILRLARHLNDASANGTKILLSYADVEAVRRAFADWNIQEISVGRSISGFAKGRKTVTEVLIKNY
tara:strand:- start:228 stop:869 length:642 start_codon:yes stop_codon:yes gene_type:complete